MKRNAVRLKFGERVADPDGTVLIPRTPTAVKRGLAISQPERQIWHEGFQARLLGRFPQTAGYVAAGLVARPGHPCSRPAEASRLRSADYRHPPGIIIGFAPESLSASSGICIVECTRRVGGHQAPFFIPFGAVWGTRQSRFTIEKNKSNSLITTTNQFPYAGKAKNRRASFFPVGQLLVVQFGQENTKCVPE